MARALISKSSITGEVKAYAGSSAPEGYLLCQGQAVSRTTYASLYDVLGTSYGQGDGVTTFNLPDYRGTFLRGRVDISTVTGSGTVPLTPPALVNTATFTNHGINRTGFKVRLSSGTLSGLAVSTDYYVIVVDSSTLAFATTLANAIAGTKVAISGANSAVIVQYEDPDYASRTAATVGGNSAGGLGSIQVDTNSAHEHFTVVNSSTVGVAISASNYLKRQSGDAESGTGYAYNLRGLTTPPDSGRTSVTGGNESRPKNSLINYIIKY